MLIHFHKFAFIHDDRDFWRENVDARGPFGLPFEPQEELPLSTEGITKNTVSPFDTRLYDQIDEDDEDSSAVPHPASALCVIIYFCIL